MRSSRRISTYLITSIAPYFLSAWLLLSVILFVQQASRFSDIFFSANIPSGLIWQLAAALIPNVIAFTCPMAALVGIVIGLTKMQGDSELVAIRASGVGTLQIIFPVAMLGVTLSGFTFLVNLYGVPFASRLVRTVALQSAIYKLESPIEPGVFNTEVAGYTIYVKDGDLTDGTWKNIFIHSEDTNTGEVRLITSQQGRIDSNNQISELVLEEGLSTTITPDGGGGERFVSEKIGELRFAVKTRRDELVNRISRTESSVEELGLRELAAYARTREGRESVEAAILWQRRLLLSVTPLVFAVLAAVLVIRFNRSGHRGFAFFISFASLITYYLLAFLGEQLVRTGNLHALVAPALPLGSAAIVIGLLGLADKYQLLNKLWTRLNKRLHVRKDISTSWKVDSNFFKDVTTGLRDFDVVRDLLRYYVITLTFLSFIFLVFTAFELWRFAGSMEGGLGILARYLFYLLPFVYLQLAPSAAMVGILATYVIKSRQNEIVTWTGAGESAYRLLVPCFILMVVLGLLNFGVQEFLAPQANTLQDHYRQQLRSRGAANSLGRLWVAEDNRIYSFLYNTSESDNETRPEAFIAYEFADRGELQQVYRAKSASWVDSRVILRGDVRILKLDGGAVETSSLQETTITAASDPFKEVRRKPNQLSIADIRSRLASTESDIEKASFAVALERKWSTIILPFIIALFTAPFALSLNRKGKAATVGYAVGLWLVFMALISIFEQFGLTGSLSAPASVWTPLILFALLGIFLLSRVRT